MNDQLANTPVETPIEDLKQISMAMKDYINTEDETAMEKVVQKINKKPGLLSRLFPNAYEKEEQRITLDRMRTIYKAKKDFFELYTVIQLEIARKQGDALIASAGMSLQTNLSKFATVKIAEMKETIDTSKENFFQRMDAQRQTVEQYKHFPELYEPAVQSMKQEIKIYFKSIEQLLEGFNAAMNSKVMDFKP